MEINNKPTVDAPLIKSVHPSGAEEHESGQSRYEAAKRQVKPIVTINPASGNVKVAPVEED